METQTQGNIGSIAAAAFKEAFDILQTAAIRTAQEKGWLTAERPVNHAEQIGLMHAELSEALEVLRTEKKQDAFEIMSEKVPEFKAIEEELADVVIRIMSYAGRHGLCVSGAVVAKMAYNRTRPWKHGGKMF